MLFGLLQRQGIGRALLTAYQTQINYAPHYLYMLKGNLPAARFYESMGGKNFPEQNRNKEYAGHDISEVIYIFAREL